MRLCVREENIIKEERTREEIECDMRQDEMRREKK